MRLSTKRLTVLGLIVCLHCAHFVGKGQTSTSSAVGSGEALFFRLTSLQPGSLNEAKSLCSINNHLVSAKLWRWLTNQASMLAGSSQDSAATVWRFELAMLVAIQLQDYELLGTGSYSLAIQYAAIGKCDNAIEALTTSSRAFALSGKLRDRFYVLSKLSLVYLRCGNQLEAKNLAEQVLTMSDGPQAIEAPAGVWPDEYGIAEALSVLAEIDLQLGLSRQAIERYGQSLELWKKLHSGFPAYASQVLNTMADFGRTYSFIGDFRNAVLQYNSSLALARQQSVHKIEATVLRSLGVLYLRQENYQLAKDYLDESLRVLTRTGDLPEVAEVSLNLGVVALRQAMFPLALSHFRRSLDLAVSSKRRDLEIVARQNIGATYRAQGLLTDALVELTKSKALAQATNDLERQAEASLRIAEVYESMLNFGQAAEDAEQCLVIARKLGLSRLSHLALVILARCYMEQTRSDKAESSLIEAVNHLEEMRGNILDGVQNQQAFFSKRVGAYHLLVDFLVRQNRNVEALHYLERAKARVLFDLVQSVRPDMGLFLTEDEKREEARLRSEVAVLSRLLRVESSKLRTNRIRVREIRSNLEMKRRQYSSYRNLLIASHNELKAPRTVPPQAGLEGLDQLIPDRKTAILEFLVTDSHLLLFAATKSGTGGQPELRVYRTPISRELFTRQVNRFHWLMSNRYPIFHPEARALYDLLLKPAASQLRGVKTLCIVPDAVLWNIPFQALESRDNHYLIEEFAIHYAPSLSVLEEVSRRKPSTSPSFFAFGNPTTQRSTRARLSSLQPEDSFEPLPEAEMEVKSIGRQFGPQRRAVFLRARATEPVFKSQAASYSVIHLATHGVFDNINPLYSYLKLGAGSGEDGLLEAHEVMDLNLPVDLVVLSACDTARGGIGAGEGIIGLSWAFLAAGSRATVVSQWPVRSGSAAPLMIEFYRNLRRGVGKAQSLRQASLRQLKSSKEDHPFYWASFVVVGSDR